MQIVELNPVGNFDPWDPSKIEELKNDNIPETRGQKLVFENDKVILWELSLLPGERRPFCKITRDFNIVTRTEGLAITRCSTGQIFMLRINKGDSAFYELNGRVSIYDLENIGENELSIHITEFKQEVESVTSTYRKSS